MSSASTNLSSRRRTSSAFTSLLSVLLLLLLYVAISPNRSLVSAKEPNLYQILGVSKTASAKEIKKAYRRKALDTHPDKNTHLPPEQSAENFRQVTRAFEILSDENSRRLYDRTGRTEQSSGGGNRPRHQQQQQGSWTFTWNTQSRGRPRRLKDRFDVQKAQSRVLHVVSLVQLQTIMLDDDELLERNLLISFVQAGKIEQHVNDEMVFPYPFAGMSPQQIWWEDLLQTVQIRFHKSNELTKFFQLQTPLKEPVFLLARRGSKLEPESFQQISTSKRQKFESWVWDQLQVEITFVNQHTHPIEVYWIHDSRGHVKLTLEPGDRGGQVSMLSHQWWVRDARVDTRPDSPNRYKLSEETCLAQWKITNDTSPQELVIERKTCYDLSGHCIFWKRQGECRKNPKFMGEDCRLTCGFCKEGEERDSVHDEF